MYIDCVGLTTSDIYYIRYGSIANNIVRLDIDKNVAIKITNHYRSYGVDIDPIVFFKDITCDVNIDPLPPYDISSVSKHDILGYINDIIGHSIPITLMLKDRYVETWTHFLKVININNKEYISDTFNNAVINVDKTRIVSSRSAVMSNISKVVNICSSGDAYNVSEDPVYQEVADHLNRGMRVDIVDNANREIIEGVLNINDANDDDLDELDDFEDDVADDNGNEAIQRLRKRLFVRGIRNEDIRR